MLTDRFRCPECDADMQGAPFYKDAECTEEAGRQWKTLVGFDDDGMKFTAYCRCPACDTVFGGELRFADPSGEA